MSLNDIYRVTAHYELPTSAASWSIYYREDIDADGGDIDTQILAEAFDTVMNAFIRAMLASDCSLPAIECRKVFATQDPKHIVNNAVAVGSQAGASLPNNCSLTIPLGQSTFSAQSDGRIRIPGIPELETGAGTVSTVFANGPLSDFITQLATQVSELSGGTGRFTPGVISAKIRDIPVPPAPKDWAGAFAPITTVTGSTIIGILRKRSTRAFGQAV